MSTKPNTDESIEALIASETYTMLPSGKVMVCELVLKNGFSVCGLNAIVDKNEFDEARGRENSRRKAVDLVWAYAGYMRQDALYREMEANALVASLTGDNDCGDACKL